MASTLQHLRRISALTALVVLVGFVASASAQERIDRALREGRYQTASQRVIVKAKPGYAPWVRQLLAQRGIDIYAQLPSIDAVAVELSSSDLDAVCFHSIALGCALDALVSPTTAKPLSTAVYAPPAINSLLGTLGLTPYAGGGYVTRASPGVPGAFFVSAHLC